MKRVALALSIAAGLATAAAAHIPRPEPDPVRLAAAQRFVATLPIAEAVSPRPDRPERMRGELVYRMVYEAQQHHGARDIERIMPSFQVEIFNRVDAALARVFPQALGDIAVAYAFEMQAADLDATARFFATPEGRAFAARTVTTDAIIFGTVEAHLVGALEPELDRILADARARQAERDRAEAAHDVLRLRVNAESRRRSRR